MKVIIYDLDGTNTGKLKKTNEKIVIKRGRWINKNVSHPMKYLKPIGFENKNVYFLHLFGDDSKLPHHGKHISLSFCENQKFLFIQNQHWLQKEENIRYIINILYLTFGLIIGFFNYFKK